MKILNKTLGMAAICLCATQANAGLIDFISLTEDAGGLGESAWNPLVLDVDGVQMTITGHATNDNAGDTQQFAYLDWNNAGLGVCKDASNAGTAYPGSGSNLCAPSSDDNVTVDEYLLFSFDQAVTIDNLWFNNNHDGGFGAGDLVNIEGNDFAVSTGYTDGGNGIGAFSVAANTAFKVAYSNEEFYISGIEVTAVEVPEPASLALLGLGLAALGLSRRRLNR